jgi:hypothetical protein
MTISGARVAGLVVTPSTPTSSVTVDLGRRRLFIASTATTPSPPIYSPSMVCAPRSERLVEITSDRLARLPMYFKGPFLLLANASAFSCGRLVPTLPLVLKVLSSLRIREEVGK